MQKILFHVCGKNVPNLWTYDPYLFQYFLKKKKIIHLRSIWRFFWWTVTDLSLEWKMFFKWRKMIFTATLNTLPWSLFILRFIRFTFRSVGTMQIVKWQMFSLFPSCLSGMYFDIFAKARIFLLPFDSIEKMIFKY